ncbi:Dynamin family protein [Anaerovibrio lipolyticus DSM 3074]|uniref:Dynamin N-terminal domain-containing protein n=2 Tax=Anaerovibrio lipolyticus TaxID=82374 RepID=A0A0B2K1B6_9FIRM|nr:dynamin family protein [Anaerovibrio lipolyticus]KHM52693.1 hypothetical protein NZ47_03255 [Anaerovibrio lipolyticus]SHJ06617.1 Dynamin family protein [Anaerovibrio lipolyticus DSM 3074]
MDTRKQRILGDIEKLKTMECVGLSGKAEALNDLASDIQNDFFTIVVLGEFKRGKSTFVNALLGEKILPTDVLPETATINAIMYSPVPTLSVVMHDGSEEAGEVSEQFLKKFSAQNPQAIAEKVKYIKIGYPADILRQNVVIVDTPGVSDINEQRCEVTYRFIPKANAILFLLDANSPLKKSEKDFIDQHLLPLGVDHILFLANKYDDVDEEEDGDLIGALQRRLREAFKMDTEEAELAEFNLFPLSALMAVEGIENDDEVLKEASGINNVINKMKEVIFSGKVEERKIQSYSIQLMSVLEKLINYLENERSLRSSDVDVLKQTQNQLQDMLRDEELRKNNIAKFVEKETQNIIAIADKSLAFFQRRLTETVTDNVNFYKGSDFKEYIESRISRMVQREMENWVASYSPHVDQLLRTMQQEISRGLTYHFNQRIQVETAGSELKTSALFFDVSVVDISDTNVKAGAVAAGGAGLMLLLGTPVLLPFISMAAFPLLQKSMLESRLSRAKDEVIPAITTQIDISVSGLRNEIHQHIQKQSEKIIANSEYAYESILNDLQQRIGAELKAKEQEQSGKKREIGDIDLQLKELSTIMTKYRRDSE